MEKLKTTDSDLYLSNNFKKTIFDYVDYKNKVCVKPWGHEFLIFESKKLGTWFLKINKDFGTSTHTHFQKDTIMIIITGKVRLNMVDNYEVFGEGSVIYIPKKKFHGINSLTEYSHLIEIEIFDDDVNFSDKNDLLRLVDNFKRENVGYKNSVCIETHTLEKYDYFYLNDNVKKTLNNTEISFGTLEDIYKNNYQKISQNKEVYILYENSFMINDKIISVGSYFTSEEIYHIYTNNANLNSKFLKISYYGLIDNKIVTTEDELVKIIENNKKINNKIVLTCGCFDILHVGHLKLLKESRKFGDKLFVLLSSDEQIKSLKGSSRPINNLEDRLNLFKILPDVDYIIPYNENLINKNEEVLDYYINLIKPDIWTKGTDYNIENIVSLHPSLKCIKLVNLEDNKSTTKIVNKIKDNCIVNEIDIKE